MDKWLNCPVIGFISWPKNKTEVIFNDNQLILLPLDDDHEKSLHLKMNKIETYEEGMTIVNRFISTLCWKNKKPVQQINEGYGAAVIHPFPIKQDYIFRYISYKDPFPNKIHGPVESKKQLALSLYREGLSLNSIPYQFLSLFKVINILYKDKYENGNHALKQWLSANITKLTSADEKERIDYISSRGEDITEYIYTSCRCAIAHAYSDPIVDPDNVEDLHRLEKDLILIRSLAELIIEREMEISNSLWE